MIKMCISKLNQMAPLQYPTSLPKKQFFLSN